VHARWNCGSATLTGAADYGPREARASPATTDPSSGLLHPHRNTGQRGGAYRANQPRDRAIGHPDAAVTARTRERIQKAGATATVDAHPPVTATELLKHVAVRRQGKDVGAQKVGR